MNKCEEYAIKYATQYGWAVFPVSPKNKKPLTPHGCKDAKKDVGAIRAWWRRWPDASIGVATGVASNLIVIDEDIDEEKGIDGYQSVKRWERDNGDLPETVRAITGRGGAHSYYHYTGYDIGNRAGILDGVDVRGEGGYVVAPPSLHPNGTEYQWECDPEEYPIANLDATVRAFLSIGSSKRENAEDFKLPAVIPMGARNDTLFRLACSLQAQGIPDEAIISAVRNTNSHSCEDPVSEDELQQIISSALRYSKGEMRIISDDIPEQRQPNIIMRINQNGEVTDQPAQTIANAEEAITYDPELWGRIRYNEVAYAPYVYGNVPWRRNKAWREWDNADDSNLRSYIESNYGLKSGEKIMDALNNVAHRYPINPIKQLLNTCHENWDGNKHVENLLPSMLGVKKTEYATAVMRLFMLGAVCRAFNPGCKFDYMLVLVGAQGKGKSSFLRFLALSDQWYNDNFNSLDGDKAVEKLRGMWIVELAELQATKRAKDVETIKSFITSRVDTYRAPYGRRTEQRPRMCVLAGTSNPTDFLTDTTGNRRFLPVTCGAVKPTWDMFADEIATKAEISQAWGEIMDEYLHGKYKLVLPAKLHRAALAAQAAYAEEDPNIGIIQNWLDKTPEERVCAIMLWREALNIEFQQPDKREIRQIHDLMRNHIEGWVEVGKQRCGEYGVQRCYARSVAANIQEDENKFLTLDPDDAPFDLI